MVEGVVRSDQCVEGGIALGVVGVGVDLGMNWRVLAGAISLGGVVEDGSWVLEGGYGAVVGDGVLVCRLVGRWW